MRTLTSEGWVAVVVDVFAAERRSGLCGSRLLPGRSRSEVRSGPGLAAAVLALGLKSSKRQGPHRPPELACPYRPPARYPKGSAAPFYRLRSGLMRSRFPPLRYRP